MLGPGVWPGWAVSGPPEWVPRGRSCRVFRIFGAKGGNLLRQDVPARSPHSVRFTPRAASGRARIPRLLFDAPAAVVLPVWKSIYTWNYVTIVC